MIKYQVGDKFHFQNWENHKHIDIYILVKTDVNSLGQDTFKLKFLGCGDGPDHIHSIMIQSDVWVPSRTLFNAIKHIKKQAILKII